MTAMRDLLARAVLAADDDDPGIFQGLNYEDAASIPVADAILATPEGAVIAAVVEAAVGLCAVRDPTGDAEWRGLWRAVDAYLALSEAQP